MTDFLDDPDVHNPPAALATNRLDDTRQQLLRQYCADDRPWVVAYSGGKDSTLVLQLVFEMLLDLGTTAHKPVYVLSSDTRVEAPNISAYVRTALQNIEHAAQARGLNVQVRLVTPEGNEGFWLNLIGKGYPPPSRWFRWCTNNMKIKPSRRAIESIARKYGSVILLLGSRIDESSIRGQGMQARTNNARGLNPHHEIPNALVFAPIAQWSTDEVWEYLYSTPPAWGGNHDDMLSLYRQANGGECPVVLDLSTPSCGGSRFGCWTCTVVKQDKSMEGFIATGEEWMIPLNDFRGRLITYRDDPTMRAKVRRDGRLGEGPFNPNGRQIILRDLLLTEKAIADKGLELISAEELGQIQSEWTSEFDYTGRMAADIATEFGREVIIMEPHTPLQHEDDILETAARDANIDAELLRNILHLVKYKYPSLEVWGAKTRLEKDIEELIAKAARQAEQAAP